MKKHLDENGMSLLQAIMAASIVAVFSYTVFDYWLLNGRRLRRTVDRTQYIDLATARIQYLRDPAVVIDAVTLRNDTHY